MSHKSPPRYERLKDYAERLGLKYGTVWKQYKEGRLPQVVKINGSLLIPIEDNEQRPMNRAALYSRVSSSENKDNLASQAQRLYDFSTARGFTVVKNVQECASGLNENRKKLWALLRDDSWDILVVEHKDRLTRFGYAYIEELVKNSGRQILVINHTNTDRDEDIVEDFVSIITSFCARIYGKRWSQRKTEKIIAQLKEETHAEG